MACRRNKHEHWGVMFAEDETGNSGIGSNIEQTRALVASLQTAVHFIQVLSESLAVVTQLLASSTMTDVQESITLLIYCHKFQVKVGSCTHQYWLSRSHGVIGAVIVVMQDAFCPHCPISSQKGCRLTVKLSVCVVSGSVQELWQIQSNIWAQSLNPVWGCCNSTYCMPGNQVFSAVCMCSGATAIITGVYVTQIYGAQAALHKVLPLMFSREQGMLLAAT